MATVSADSAPALARQLGKWKVEFEEWEQVERPLGGRAASAARDVTAGTRGGEQRWDHPGNRLLDGCGLPDAWYLDDGIIVAHPGLAVPFVQALDQKTLDQRG